MGEFEEFIGAAAQEPGLLESAGDAIIGGLDAAGDWIFGEDGNDDVFGFGGTEADQLPDTVGGMGLVDLGAAMGSPQAQNAALALVRSVMGSGVVATIARTMLDQLPGVIFDAREPSYQGSPLTNAMLSILFRKLSKNEQEAVVERLAGGMSPLSDKAATRKAFRLLYVYDALRSLNEKDAAEAIFYGQK